MEPRVNILLVDDHPENLTALEAVLGDFGQNLVSAGSGAEALKHLLEQDFALVLLDVQMPGMDGFETARLIRERERSRLTPILFLTAIGFTDRHIAAGYAAGGVDYLFKPLDTHILRAKVAAFIELAKRARQLEAEVKQRKLAEGEVRRLNRDLENRVRERTAALQAEVGERRRAEAEVAALNQDLQRRVNEFQALLDVTPIGISVSHDPECGTVFNNRALSRMTGVPVDRNASLTAPEAERPTSYRLCRDGKDIAPADLPMQYAALHGVPVANTEIQVVREDGAVFDLYGNAAPLFDHAGEVVGCVGAFIDISERKRTEEALRRREAELRLITDAVPSLISYIDRDTRYVFCNSAYYEWFGVPQEAVVGRSMVDVLGEHAFQRLTPHIDAALAGRRATFEGEIPYKTGGKRWVRADYVPLTAGTGEVDGFVALVHDITAAKRREAGLRFLAEASSVLASSLDSETTLEQLAQLAVPQLADWCAVDVLGLEGEVRRLAVAHMDPAKVRLARELRERYPPDPARPGPLHKVIRTGETEVLDEVSEAQLRGIATNAEHLRLLTELQMRSCIIAPLQAGGAVLGTLTLVLSESERRFGPEDVALAEELAHRAALAMEKARLYQELRDADQRKDEFLAMLAHELRNPLAPLRTAAEVMRLRGSDDPALRRARDLIDRQTGTLSRLVDDLLDVSRITRGKIQLRMEPLELGAFLRHVGEAYAPSLQERQHRFRVDTPPEPVWVEADATRLEQIVGNLLSNAAKYTEVGGEVTLSLEDAGRGDTGARPEAAIRVRDTGIGIPPELLGRVFDLFAQADRTLDRAQGGLGIGLTLVKSLTELHGGTVDVFSDGPGRGSEFTVRLPLLEHEAGAMKDAGGPVRTTPEERSVSDTPIHPSSPCLHPCRKRVLVVDDNEDAAETLAELLELWGFEVLVAHDGEAGLEIARRFEPDVAILDIGLPQMNGYELARQLRKSGNGKMQHDGSGEPAQPSSFIQPSLLVAVTGYGQDGDRVRAREAGFDHHFTKPVDVEALRQALERVRLEPADRG